MLQIQCPSCTPALSMPENMVGKQVRCPLCSNTFQVSGQGGDAAPQAAAPPPPRAPAPPEQAPYDYEPREPREPRSRPQSRSREYDEYGDGDAYNPDARAASGRTSAAVWMLIAGILDLVVLLAFYVFVFTVDGRPPPPEALITITLIAVVFYLAPLVFIFVAAGVMRGARGSGLIITGSVMAFIIAFELLLVTAGFAIGLVAMLSSPFGRPRMPAMVPIMFFLSLAGLVISIVAGVRALMAISRAQPRRSDRYYY